MRLDYIGELKVLMSSIATALLGLTHRQDAEKRAKNLEEAKSIVIKEDPSLPPAKKVGYIHLTVYLEQSWHHTHTSSPPD